MDVENECLWGFDDDGWLKCEGESVLDGDKKRCDKRMSKSERFLI